MRNACGTAGRTYSAHNAVKGFLRALVELSALSVCDILHNVQILRATLCAGIAADTRIYFGIKLHHYLLGRFYLLYIIYLFDKREERKRRNIHIVFDFCLTGKAGFEFSVAFDSVNRCARTAEAVTATASANKLISRIFHGAHDGQVIGNAVFLSEQVNVYHIFHVHFLLISIHREVRRSRRNGKRGRLCKHTLRRCCICRTFLFRTSCEVPLSCIPEFYQIRVPASPQE